MRQRCLLLCKDKNFKANHNREYYDFYFVPDVCYYAKIRILKQITTDKLIAFDMEEMFVTMQR